MTRPRRLPPISTLIISTLALTVLGLALAARAQSPAHGGRDELTRGVLEPDTTSLAAFSRHVLAR